MLENALSDSLSFKYNYTNSINPFISSKRVSKEYSILMCSAHWQSEKQTCLICSYKLRSHRKKSCMVENDSYRGLSGISNHPKQCI